MGIARKRKLVGSFTTAEEPAEIKAGVVAKSEAPDESWTKAQITDYLDENAVEWTSSMTKAELLEQLEKV